MPETEASETSGLQFEWALPAHLRIVESRHGRFLVPARDMYVGRSLAVYGEWCEPELALAAKLLKPGDVVVDAGANIGSHAVAFARMVGGTGRVYAIEAQPGLAQILGANAILNAAARIVCLNAGLAAGPGHLDLPPIDYGAADNFGGITMLRFRDAARRAGGVRIALTALDDLVELPRLALLKLDVERMEADVLRGARRTIERCRPAIYLENDKPEDTPAILAELESHGYSGYWHVCPLFSPKNFRGNPQNIFGDTACVNMICLPRERKVTGFRPATGAETHPRHPDRIAQRAAAAPDAASDRPQA